jgi:hypothetical protein
MWLGPLISWTWVHVRTIPWVLVFELENRKQQSWMTDHDRRAETSKKLTSQNKADMTPPKGVPGRAAVAVTAAYVK